MKGYVVCVYKNISDQEKLKEYAQRARVVVEKFKGKFLIRGGRSISNEGEKSPRTVVIEFSSFEQAKAFYQSKDYQDAHTILKDHAERQFQIIEGT